MPATTRSIGYRRPITPVEATNTSIGSHPSRAAMPSTRVLASSKPAGPFATLAFFETITIARACRFSRCCRLSTTLGPANLLRVNTPAAGTGRSAEITTKSSVSSLMPTLATWQRKPGGRLVTGSF